MLLLHKLHIIVHDIWYWLHVNYNHFGWTTTTALRNGKVQIPWCPYQQGSARMSSTDFKCDGKTETCLDEQENHSQDQYKTPTTTGAIHFPVCM